MEKAGARDPGRRTILKPLPIRPNISAAPVSLGCKVKVNNDAAVCFAWQAPDVNLDSLDLEYQAPSFDFSVYFSSSDTSASGQLDDVH